MKFWKVRYWYSLSSTTKQFVTQRILESRVSSVNGIRLIKNCLKFHSFKIRCILFHSTLATFEPQIMS